ncbi:MAG TPA: ergothioneine biosynthesis protein EgtB [Chthoniobacterales bacterium]|nr:ergothioneine biosynthesis protein EgtB [Chthoniobacterales bacterium]
MQLRDKARSEDLSNKTETATKLRTAAGTSKGAEVATTPGSEMGRSENLRARYRVVREFSEKLCERLEPEDCVVQTMPEASPVKWHLAHTSWFFETFVLKAAVPNYDPINPQYAYLFNSYYNSAGKMHCRPKRGLISRPTLRETLEYRRRVDELMEVVLAKPASLEKFAPVIELGLHHEQQHQELILTDIKHVFSENPLRPAFCERVTVKSAPVAQTSWLSFPAGVCEVGYKGVGFHFDNEGPHHRQFVEAFQLMPRLVTNGEYLEFIEDGGYRRPEFWLSLGWYTVNEQRWEAPLYWERRDENWWVFTLAGMRELDKDEPVCHLSYFEADAFARWAKARLPSEFEWEVAAADLPYVGNFADTKRFHPEPLDQTAAPQPLAQMFGDVWEWTNSSYSPYPGYVPTAGALGEYNGKFMCNQYVLRGGSCATSQSHIRKTYRNFFPPNARWQFMGLRLARTVA